jgi:hypothetical protein
VRALEEENHQLRAHNQELEAARRERASTVSEQPKPKPPKPGKSATLTIKQHHDALIELLQDEPEVALMQAVNSFNRRIRKIWYERRKKKNPANAPTPAQIPVRRASGRGPSTCRAQLAAAFLSPLLVLLRS